ncbi:hypothetical protein DXG01_008786 [Tephrocybe rancida]|nr:hypothetical protein DXG01_008786 [Tephrocybe rancida]
MQLAVTTLFTAVFLIAQLAIALPIYKSKIGPVALAKLSGQLADFAPLGGLLPRDDVVVSTETTTVSAAEQHLIDAITQSMDSVLEPLEAATSLDGLKLKTTLEFEKEKAPVVTALTADGTVSNPLSGLKFKATVELEQDDNSGSSGSGDENEPDEDEFDNDEEDEDEEGVVVVSPVDA